MTIFFGCQTVKNTDDALLQGRSAHDAVVDNHQIILLRNKASVSDVVYVGGQVIAAVAFGNEGTQLDVFDSHFLTADALGKNLFQFARDWDYVPRLRSVAPSAGSDSCPNPRSIP